MEAKGLAPDTQRHTRAVLRTALRKAEQEGLVTRNVAAIADGPRVSRPEGRTLTNAEADALLAAAAASPSRRPGSPGRRSEAFERLEPAIVLGLYLGLRKGEILGLRWDDIDLDSPLPLLNVRQQLVRRPNGLGLGLTEPKTPKSKRSVHLPDRVVAALRTQRARQGRDRLAMGSEWKDTWGLVFTTQTGTPVDPRNFNRVFSKIAMSAGLGHWHPHELRHSTASLMLAEGVPLEVVSVVLGHASIRTTKDTYGHVLPNMLATAAQAMDRALS